MAVTGAALWSVWPSSGTQAQYARAGYAYPDAAPDSALRLFDLASLPDDAAVAKAKKMTANWDTRSTAPLMELERITGLSPEVRKTLWPALRTGLGLKATADDQTAGRIEIQHALWSRADREDLPDYDDFKALLYQRIDPRFGVYFRGRSGQSDIRLDEVQWGGVRRDGIPPLKDPEVVSAGDRAAAYLGDHDVVFGVEVNGETRAYPKRILAWHEMVKDHLGGVSINGVYCTLCGAMIVYDTELDGVHYELGTSGFLYRSNKLMYDHATESMWSTTRGEPVIGPLVGQEIRLIPRTVVTTTWGRWKTLHPETTVLTLATGHRRDYGEGVAYHSYFATDRLMFQVPPDRSTTGQQGGGSGPAFWGRWRGAPRLRQFLFAGEPDRSRHPGGTRLRGADRPVGRPPCVRCIGGRFRCVRPRSVRHRRCGGPMDADRGRPGAGRGDSRTAGVPQCLLVWLVLRPPRHRVDWGGRVTGAGSQPLAERKCRDVVTLRSP